MTVVSRTPGEPVCLAGIHAERAGADLKRLHRYRLLVVDGVGYLPFDAASASLPFQLVASRYETGSIVLEGVSLRSAAEGQDWLGVDEGHRGTNVDLRALRLGAADHRARRR